MRKQIHTYFPKEQAKDYERIQKFFEENPHIPDSAISRAWLLDMLDRAERNGIDPRTLLPLGPKASTDESSEEESRRDPPAKEPPYLDLGCRAIPVRRELAKQLA